MANIKIDDKLYAQIKSKLKESGFSSVDEYAETILTDFVVDKKESHSKEDEEKVKARLKALGYL
jgi:hypothetical protein